MERAKFYVAVCISLGLNPSFIQIIVIEPFLYAKNLPRHLVYHNEQVHSP